MKAPAREAGLRLIDEAWQETPQDERPGILLAFPFYEGVDMEELLGPVREAGVRVFADSGAFSAWRSGTTVDLEAYAAWLDRWKHLFDLYANLDVIGDAQGTLDNQRALEAHGLRPLPTIHYGAPYAALDEAVAEAPPYLALGGMVGRMTYENKNVMRWCVGALTRTQRAGIKVHGYGVTRWEAIWELPWQSVDSTTWQNGSRYGSLLLFTGTRLFQARATQLVDNLPAIRACGFSVEEAYKGVSKVDPRIAAVIALRSVARAQAAVRRRHARPDFTIYCAAIL